MPIQYVIDLERNLVVSTASGRVTFAEFKAHQDQLLADPSFRSDLSQVIDGTAVTSTDISTNELRTLTHVRVFSAESRRAFVASDPAIFGVARMAEVYMELARTQSRIRVFRDLASALKWLGLPDSEAAMGGNEIIT